MKRIIATVMLALMLLTLLPISVSAETAATADSTPKKIDVEWYGGYVASSTHSSIPDRLSAQPVPGGGLSSTYRYSDIITIAEKGTTIYFHDPDSGNASSNAYVISSWKKNEGGSWILDKTGARYFGNGDVNGTVQKKDTDGYYTYTYTTWRDNESIRLCYCCVANTQVLPDVYVVKRGDAPTDNNLCDIKLETNGVISGIIWRSGYIGSTANVQGCVNLIKQDAGTYTYTELIQIPKKGTKITFTDPTSPFTVGSAWLLSSWKLDDVTGNWIVDPDGANYDGNSTDIMTVSGSAHVYNYITYKDNEVLRFCYQSASSTGVVPTNNPVVYWQQTNETPTFYPTGAAEMKPVTEKGKLVTADYKDGAGVNASYKVYLPESYSDKYNGKVIFNVGANTEIVDALIAEKTDAVIFSIDAQLADAKRFITLCTESYSFNTYSMYLVGDQTLYNECKNMFVNHIKDKTGYSSASDAAKALLSVKPLFYGILNNIVMYAMGDSYFGGSSLGKELTWVNQMGYKYGMDFINYGIGGSTVSDFITNKNPMVIRSRAEVPKTNADVILLEGGRNDRSNLVPMGTNDSLDSKTFLGALNIMINAYLKRSPKAIIILVTPWYNTGKASNGNTNLTYADAMVKLAQYRNDPRVICLNAADKAATGVNMDDAAFRAKYCVAPTDVSHLNADGMAFIQPYMEKFIATALAEYRGLDVDGNKKIEPEQTTASIPETTLAPIETTLPPDAITTADVATVTTAPVVEKQKGCGKSAVYVQLAALICGMLCFTVIKKKH